MFGRASKVVAVVAALLGMAHPAFCAEKADTKAAAAKKAERQAEQAALAAESEPGLINDYFDSHGWGFGVAMVTRRTDVAGSIGSFGWDGGLGTSWRSDPREEMVGILLTQASWTSPNPPNVALDFWTSAYGAIED